MTTRTDDRSAEGDAPSPALFFFPYLAVPTRMKFGPWSAVPLSQMPLPWRNTATGARCVEVLAGFQSPAGSPELDPTLIARSPGEPTDLAEREAEWQGVASAVAFALIDSNSRGGKVDWLNGRSLHTTEAATFIQAMLDLENGYAPAPTRGGLVQQRMGGIKLSDPAYIVPPPEHLLSTATIELDHELVQATYATCTAGQDDTHPEESRVDAAIHWFLKAWDNSPAVSTEDRIVYLKTALESLSGHGRTEKQVAALDAIYAAIEGTTGAHHFMWTDDPTTYERTDDRGNVYQQRAFERWYWFLTDARNGIIHATRRPEVMHIQPGSPFEGHLFRVGERVCRELIKIRLAQLGYPLVTLDSADRRAAAWVKEQGKEPALVSCLSRS